MNPLHPLALMGTGTLFTWVSPLAFGLASAQALPNPVNPGDFDFSPQPPSPTLTVSLDPQSAPQGFAAASLGEPQTLPGTRPGEALQSGGLRPEELQQKDWSVVLPPFWLSQAPDEAIASDLGGDGPVFDLDVVALGRVADHGAVEAQAARTKATAIAPAAELGQAQVQASAPLDPARAEQLSTILDPQDAERGMGQAALADEVMAHGVISSEVLPSEVISAEVMAPAAPIAPPQTQFVSQAANPATFDERTADPATAPAIEALMEAAADTIEPEKIKTEAIEAEVTGSEAIETKAIETEAIGAETTATDAIETEAIETEAIEAEATATEIQDWIDLGVDLNDPRLRPLLADPNPLALPFDPAQVTIENTFALTLAEVVALALHNNPTLQAQEVALLQQREALRQQQAQWLPTLTFDSNIQRTGSGTEILGTNAPVFSAPSDSTQGTTTLNGTVRIDYGIYDPDRRPSIRAAEAQVRQAELLLEQVREQLRLDATSDYYQLQNADEQVRIASGAVSAAESSLKDAQSLERAGVGTRFAVLQAEVQLANERQNLVNARSNKTKAQRQIAQRLSLPFQIDVVAADSVAPAGQWPLGLEDSIVLAFDQRPELEQNLLERDVSDAQRQVALASIRPNLGVFGQYSLDTNLSETSSGGTKTTQDTFGRQYAIGVNLNWRFFDGGATRASARRQELGRETAELEFASNRNEIRQQVEEAYYDLQANQQNIETASLGVGQARDALCLARLRFQAGVGTQIDVINAERDLTRAEGNVATAIVNYNLALAQMQRATSDFSLDLPASPPLPTYQSSLVTRNGTNNCQ